MTPARALLPLILPLLAVSALGGPKAPVGPRLGNVRYRGDLTPGPQGADTDDFVAALLEGERLSVTVTSPFDSALFPTLSVRDPARVERDDVNLRDRRVGKVTFFKAMTADTTGYWLVRVGGEGAGNGGYVLRSKIKPMKAVKLEDCTLSAQGDATCEIEIPGMDAARLDLTIKWTKESSPVRLLSMLDPDGNEVVVDGVPLAHLARPKGRNGIRVRKEKLVGPLGTYRLTLAVDSGDSRFDVKYRVLPTDRPKGRGKKRLTTDEPFVDPVPSPRRGVHGLRFNITGRNFSFPALPEVLFGGKPATIEERSEFGNRLTVVPPPGVDDSTVSVAVVNTDGQGFEREAYFYYVPEPTITAILDEDGNPVLGGSVEGGRRVRLLGTFFQAGVRVRFGVASVATFLHSSEDLEVTVPQHGAGEVEVVAFDSFKHEAVAPTAYRFKEPPAIDAEPYAPAVVARDTATTVLLSGRFFEQGDQVLLDGVAVTTNFGADTLLGFLMPASSAGSYGIQVRDRFGTVSEAPVLRVKLPPEIDVVAIHGGPVVGASGVPLEGGTQLRITGANFDLTDSVTIGGSAVEFDEHAEGRFVVTVPPGSFGDADLVLTDIPGTTVTRTAVIRYVGYQDKTTDRSPGSTNADDISARRAVMADLDDDGDVNDVAIASFDSSPGTRLARTRILVNDGAGALADRTGIDFPGALAGEFDATALALGDLDGEDGADLVIGFVPAAGDTDTAELRFLENGGTGVFTRNTGWEPGTTYRAAVNARDQNGTDWLVFGASYPQGKATGIAIGDLDGDDAPDIVLARDHYEMRLAGVDPAYVDFTVDPYSVTYADATNQYLDRYEYFSATRVFENRIGAGGGFADVTESWLPGAGTSDDTTPRPAFHARDVALGDLDGDGDLDIVLTWDDPTTVTATGLSTDTAADSARIATRILTNDGFGAFTDVTSTFLPAASTPEFFQAHRVRLADLNGDGRLDIVLLLEQDLNAFQSTPAYTRHALRVLRNDGAGASPRFSNVTTQVLPGLRNEDDENYRGSALVIGDVNGDGSTDILVGATAYVPRTQTGTRLRATRLLLGAAGFLFTDGTSFLPAPSTDSGEADELLLGDLAGGDDPSLIVLSETTPNASFRGEPLRVFEWNR